MESNKQTLRILFLYDTSGSMPKYYQGEYINNFASTLQKELDAIYPSLIVEKEKAESYHFNALLKASQRDYDLVVYLQDGCNNDAYLPENEIIYKSGPPAVILNVKDSKNANIANYHIMAEATNGVVIEANDVDNTVIAIKKYLTDKKPSPYIFTYYNAEITKEHEVVVHLDSKRLSAKDDYEVIDTVNYPVVENLIGLYLSVTINNRETKRVLAGWDPVLNKNIEPNFDHFKELRNTMLGGAIISFEGEGPTISAALSDVLKYRLSTKNWMEPFLDNDLEKAKKALQTEGSLMYNSLFVPLMAPLEGAVTKNTFTFASGIRIAILKNRLGVDQKTTSISFDYLPTSHYTSLAATKETAFKTTLQKTAQLALREKAYFKENTFSLLENKDLLNSKLAYDTSWVRETIPKENPDNPFWNALVYTNDNTYKIFDECATHKAYWQIHSTTGELYGILANGTGGGENSIISQLLSIENVITLYKELLSKAGYGLATGIVITYLATLVKLYGIVSVVVATMDATGMDDSIKAALAELACNIGKDILFNFNNPALGAVGKLDMYLGIMGAGGVIKC
jgi:hypothetical protein